MNRYFTPRFIGMHVTLFIVLPAFAWLTWWQFERAYHGNTLSWAYTFEWPLFAGYAIYVWWQLIHDDPTAFDPLRTGLEFGPDGEPLGPQDEPGWALRQGRRAQKRVARAHGGTPTEAWADAGRALQAEGGGDEPEITEEEDPELAEYNRYLADLNANSKGNRW